MDGCTLDGKDEKERVIKCLEAAIQRRTSEVGTCSMGRMNRVKLYDIKVNFCYIPKLYTGSYVCVCVCVFYFVMFLRYLENIYKYKGFIF